MNIFQFLILLGIINIVFDFVWKWLFVLPAAILFTVIKFDQGILILKSFGAYLLISLTALETMFALTDIDVGLKFLFFPIVGALVLFTGFASNAYEQRKQAATSHDYNLINQINRNAWFDTVLMFGSVILFVLILFVPGIAVNFLTEWLFNLIWWVYELPVIGWMIGFGGVLFMINTLWYGFLMILVIVEGIRSKINKETQDNINVIDQ